MQRAAKIVYEFGDGKDGCSKGLRLKHERAGFEAFRIIGSLEFDVTVTWERERSNCRRPINMSSDGIHHASNN